MSNYVYTQNCSFIEWYDTHKKDIISMFHMILEWIDDGDFYVYNSRKGFYKKFVYFVYKNSVPYIIRDEENYTI